MGFPMAFPLKPPFSYGFQQPLRFLWQCWDLVSAPFLAGLRRQNASKPGAWRSVVLIHGNSGWCRRVHMAVIWWWWENLNRKPWFFYHEIGWAFSGFSGLISVFFPTFRSHVAWTPSMMPGESEMIALRNRSAGNITFKMKTKWNKHMDNVQYSHLFRSSFSNH